LELFFDTETTGIALFKEPASHEKQPNVVQLAAILSDKDTIYAEVSMLVTPCDIDPKWTLSAEVQKVHGITKEMLEISGIPTSTACIIFRDLVLHADLLVCHNVDFDRKMMQVAYTRAKQSTALKILTESKSFCTMKTTTNLCKLPGPWRGAYKWPKLMELHKFLFGAEFEDAHDALADVRATRKCYYKLKEMGI
jgi:DNA polymerase III epsilon subunit-like protein